MLSHQMLLCSFGLGKHEAISRSYLGYLRLSLAPSSEDSQEDSSDNDVKLTIKGCQKDLIEFSAENLQACLWE